MSLPFVKELIIIIVELNDIGHVKEFIIEKIIRLIIQVGHIARITRNY